MAIDLKPPVPSVPTRQMLRRILVLMAVFGLGAAALLLTRLYHLQIV